MSWHSVHIGYHDADLGPLLLDGVRPAMERLAGDRAFFVPHWRRGPHVRLNFDVAGNRYRETIRPVLDETVGGWLAAHPSTTHLRPDEHLPAHRRLAELECDTGPLVPWYADNSINDADHDDRSAVLGGTAAALVADFYVRTNDLAFQTFAAVRAGESRMAVAFDLMLATAHTFVEGGLADGFVSFRSHAEGFLENFAEGRGQRAGWDAAYARRRGAFARRLRLFLDAPEPAPLVARWLVAAGELAGAGESSLNSGELTFDNGTGPAGVIANRSGFHRALAENRTWREEVLPSTWFGVFRLVLNALYLHLTRVGITPVERFFLCHAAANAVEEEFRLSAADLVTSEWRR
ncbi:thiopeptide maturation pyridine synthase [Virgisporangium aurantiacum]|uniref:Thiopeptide-type bacteriocin biosynthesis domain-containing protein n=1 Tax=Virgisporangium aurantiacum TaxID=175570 RepID=A0A8J3ZHB5_9ACTN|nr:thiopeptide maturation pyridine synthase [Virgisporangium aurantiacum]GIJ63826.1 hypothetical protein Vau01_113420 [Virgisporangium aurantiacum]